MTPITPMKCAGAFCLCTAALLAWSGLSRGADWPQWGGTDARNLISGETNLPVSFVPGEKKPDGSVDLSTTRNVAWAVSLGSAAYGNPTVAGGRVFVGTDDVAAAADPRLARSRGGMVRCFEEATGRLLWQLVIPQRKTGLPKGTHFSQQHLGVCSSPTIDGERAYVVASNGDILCLDVRGQANGNDGPFVDEARYMVAPDKPPVELASTDADIIWRFDPTDQLGVSIHDAASCSVLIHDDVLYTGTSNGVDASHEKMVAPSAPALIALDKRTGRLVGIEKDRLSSRLFHCQWSSPSLARVGDKTLIFLGGGDGVCYAFEALAGPSEKVQQLRKVWSYDCNPPQYKARDGKAIRYTDGDKRKRTSPNKNDGRYVGPSDIIGTPVFYNNRIYVATGQDPAHGRGKGMLHCIDATKTGDITESGRIWSYDGLDRTISTPSIAQGLLFIPDIAGRIHCLDADTGKVHWVYETGAETWGGPLIADGRIYFGTQKEFLVMAAAAKPQVLAHMRLGSPVYSTPVAANGTLFVASQRYLWAVRANAPPSASTAGKVANR